MWLLPSLARPASLIRFFAAYQASEASTPGIVIIDEQDFARDEYRAFEKAMPLPPGWHFRITKGRTQGDKIREIWDEIKNCAWLGLIGDDCVPETVGWDRRMVSALDGWNIVSCDDCWQAPVRVGNCWVMSGPLVREMGYIFAPGMHHLFVDDLWEMLGREAACWRVLMGVKVRHVHVLKGEATPDDTHRLVYGSDTSDPRTGLWPLDRPAFLRWLAAERGRIVATVIAKRLDLGLAAVPAVRDDRAEQQARLERARTRSVFIATPIARHPTRQFLNCYIKTTSLLLQLGIRMFVQQVAGSSNLPRARNELVAHFLASDYTDLLFIDDDMAWDANDVLRLLASDKPMIGGVGCKKVERPDTVPEKWCFCAHEPLHQDEMGAIEVEAVGTGFLKIAREVFEQLAQAHPDWKRNGAPSMSDTVRANYYRFFRFPDDDIDDPGEDIEFCREWRRNGGEVWIDPAIRLGHVGEKEYSGDFTALLEPENEIGRIQPRRAGH